MKQRSISISLISLSKVFADYLRYCIGSFHTPYETYRSLAVRKDTRYIPFTGLSILFYLSVAGLAKGGLKSHPFILTASFLKVVSAIVFTYLFSVVLISGLGYLMINKIKIKEVAVLWSFSLLPTSIWFILASFLYLALPPPRTMNLWGQLASSVFIALSFSLFFWKGILYYLTIRFAFKLDILKIFIFSQIFLTVMVFYSFIFYKLGIFRIPFI